MKTKRIVRTLFFAVLVISTSSCTKHSIIVLSPKNAPPGQVKKATGAQSAKAYAPGQQKKQGKKVK